MKTINIELDIPHIPKNNVKDFISQNEVIEIEYLEENPFLFLATAQSEQVTKLYRFFDIKKIEKTTINILDNLLSRLPIYAKKCEDVERQFIYVKMCKVYFRILEELDKIIDNEHQLINQYSDEISKIEKITKEIILNKQHY